MFDFFILRKKSNRAVALLYMLIDLQQFLAGTDAELGIYVFIVELQRIFGDAELRHHFSGGGSGNIGIIDTLFSGGQ